MFKTSQVSLRNALPLSLLAVFVLLPALLFWDALSRGEADALERGQRHALLQAEHLARTAQRDLLRDRTAVGADLSVAMTEPRMRALVVLDADGAVVLAHRLAWQGHAAREVVPGFSPDWFGQVTQGRRPELRTDAQTRRIQVMAPYFVDRPGSALRSLARGVVYLEFDLVHEYELVLHRAVQRLLLQLGVAAVLVLTLGWLLRRYVTRPLAAVEQAARQLSAQPDAPCRWPRPGPRKWWRWRAASTA